MVLQNPKTVFRLGRLGVCVVLLVFAVTAGCGASEPLAERPTVDSPDDPAPRVVQPGAPGQPTRAVDAEELRGRAIAAHTTSEVRFMQDMIHHHSQAVEMGALVAGRTDNPDIQALAHRIELSQEDEMALMSRWLEERDEPLPTIHPTIAATADQPVDSHAGHHAHHNHEQHGHENHMTDDNASSAHHDHAAMPGMLTPEQMQQLADARGPEFDRLFLEFMIMHHEGALIMVEQLLAEEGAGQHTDIFSFASHVDSDQRIEILRMRRMLQAMNQPTDN